MPAAQRLDVWPDCGISPYPARAHSVCYTLLKAQKRSIDEPREEMQKKRKVSEAEEEKDEQRFAFKILKPRSHLG